MTPDDHQAIAGFARDTLGCRCEAAVFRSITLDSGRLDDAPVPFARIVIGQRLLIYLVRTVPGRTWPNLLPALVEAGRRERDTRSYNRFRLVLADGDAAALGPLFQAVIGADDKAHLHVVPESSWPPPVRRL